VRIAVVGKYTDFVDSYKSVQEALIHGGIANDVGVEIDWVGSDRFTDAATARRLLLSLETPATPKNREEEAARAKARSAQRFARPALD